MSALLLGVFEEVPYLDSKGTKQKGTIQIVQETQDQGRQGIIVELYQVPEEASSGKLLATFPLEAFLEPEKTLEGLETKKGHLAAAIRQNGKNSDWLNQNQSKMERSRMTVERFQRETFGAHPSLKELCAGSLLDVRGMSARTYREHLSTRYIKLQMNSDIANRKIRVFPAIRDHFQKEGLLDQDGKFNPTLVLPSMRQEVRDLFGDRNARPAAGVTLSSGGEARQFALVDPQ